jgi:hypothetical protein
MMSVRTNPRTQADAALLERLNQQSVSNSFTPEIDIDWEETTTDEEFARLYPVWSLLAGTGFDATLDERGRIAFAKYQQVNLMTFTALLERHAIATLAKLYDLDPTPPFSEYVGHFIKEEVYHFSMFQKAAVAIEASMPGARPLPVRRADLLLRWIFRLAGLVPGRKLRFSVFLSFFRFAEQVTLHAHRMVRRTLPREKSLVAQVWARHARDEARHVVFDALVLERCRLPGALARLARRMAAPCGVLLSMALNANEIWIARELGLPVRLHHLPRLVRSTQAPFKRQVFDLLRELARGSNESRTTPGEIA